MGTEEKNAGIDTGGAINSHIRRFGRSGAASGKAFDVPLFIAIVITVACMRIAPQTIAGKTLAAMVTVSGYSIVAIPTGIVTAEIVESAVGGRFLRDVARSASTRVT